MAFSHFNQPRLERVIAIHRQYEGFAAALARLADTDVLQNRQKLKASRTFDDDWFFNRFGMNV